MHHEWVGRACMLKNHAMQTMHFCADQAVQILGAMGYARSTRERAHLLRSQGDSDWRRRRKHHERPGRVLVGL